MTRPATAADLDWVMALVERLMRGYVEASVGHWDGDEARAKIAATLPDWQVHLDGSDVIAVTHVERTADAIWLRQVYAVHPGRGFGTPWVRSLLDEAGLLPVRLRVLRANPAVALYLRLGFVVAEETPERLYLVAHPPVERLSTLQLSAYNAADVDAFCACYHPEVVVMGHDGAVRMAGMAAFRESYGRMFAEHEGVGAAVDTRLALGPHVVERERWWRTNRATGVRTEGVVLVRYTADEGRIRWVEFLR